MNKKFGRERKTEDDIRIAQQSEKLQSITPKNRKEQMDLERHRKRLQRQCNHKYDISGICTICGKERG